MNKFEERMSAQEVQELIAWEGGLAEALDYISGDAIGNTLLGQLWDKASTALAELDAALNALVLEEEVEYGRR